MSTEYKALKGWNTSETGAQQRIDTLFDIKCYGAQHTQQVKITDSFVINLIIGCSYLYC